ncbi:MAG: site-specific integrase [Clostridia bacterium]|nr:site-specific integrase [Clostridia bacterium]
MSSCGVIEYVQNTVEDLQLRSALDEEKKISWVSGEAIEYQGTTYYLSTPATEWIHMGGGYMDFENYVLIGWGGMRYGYVDRFYADTEENPLFIYERRLDWIFFREGYDYQTDLYRVEGTEAFISYKDALTETNLSFQRDKDYDTYTIVKLVCKSHARMELELDVIYANGVWCISPVKTLTSKRVVDMPKTLSKVLFDRKKAITRAKQEQGFKNRANEIVMDIRDTVPVEVIGADFVNRKLGDGLAGKLLTTNSLKFYSKKISQECGFSLKMHKLRKTNLTYLAENGASFKYLKEHAGHIKVETTLKYYIKAGETSKEQGMRILNTMTTEDPLITIEGPGIGGQETRTYTVRKSQWDRIQNEQKRKK